MATCALTGDLLQPSYPLTPLDQQLTNYSNGDPPAFSLWGSYTSVPSNFTHVNLWFLGFVFGGGIKHQNDPEKTGGATVSVTQADLAPMVDATALPSPLFGSIPVGSFRGSGRTFPTLPGVTQWVAWNSQWLNQGRVLHEGNSATVDCNGVEVVSLDADGVSVPMRDTIVNVAPVFGHKALLGEAGKITAVSTYRFVAVVPKDDGISTTIRGKPGENVTLLFAIRSQQGLVYTEFSCMAKPVIVDQSGQATVHF
eukprot:SAG31_NODE_3702_length_3974_cov_13.982452_2_plen_254_part_00